MSEIIYRRAKEPVHIGLEKWIRENEKFFLPPVCNKMMHDTQLKVFYVGGPNQRKDFHLEEGEELFFMRKGDMCLKIQETGKFKDIHIKEGEIFLLPAKMPHSPQRQAGTVGLVVERERLATETDGLRYFVEGSTESLFERWFYCDDLGAQLGPVIKEFFASEQYKTGKPIPSDMPAHMPWHPDGHRIVEPPFDLSSWIDSNINLINSEGELRLFDPRRYQSDVIALGGKSARNLKSEGGETFLWQVRGESEVCLADSGKVKMVTDDTFLVPEGSEFGFEGKGKDCVVISVKMNPGNKKRIVDA